MPMYEENDALPHTNLLTRIMPSPKGGVGVFAIRAIPAGTRLFVGDEGKVVRVSTADVQKIEDPEVRRMYMDFCPVDDGYFTAPADFNQMTMGWYLNHSDEPNVNVSEDLHFVAITSIGAGEELTADYRTYSDHAQAHIDRWNSLERGRS